jgi:hypothetical protein
MKIFTMQIGLSDVGIKKIAAVLGEDETTTISALHRAFADLQSYWEAWLDTNVEYESKNVDAAGLRFSEYLRTAIDSVTPDEPSPESENDRWDAPEFDRD